MSREVRNLAELYAYKYSCSQAVLDLDYRSREGFCLRFFSYKLIIVNGLNRISCEILPIVSAHPVKSRMCRDELKLNGVHRANRSNPLGASARDLWIEGISQ